MCERCLTNIFAEFNLTWYTADFLVRISVAGAGKRVGRRAKRSFLEIVRLVKEIQPSFIFSLKTSLQSRTRGLDRVVSSWPSPLHDIVDYSQCRLGFANHKRDRVVLVGYSKTQWTRYPSIAGSDGKNDKENRPGRSKPANLREQVVNIEMYRETFPTDTATTGHGRNRADQERRTTEFRNNGEKQSGRPTVWKLPEQGGTWLKSATAGQELADTLREGLQGQWESPSSFTGTAKHDIIKLVKLEPMGSVVNEWTVSGGQN